MIVFRDLIFFTLTPDENLIHDSPVSFDLLRQHGVDMQNVKNMSFVNCNFDGLQLNELKNISYFQEDGLILSFCHAFDKKIASRLGKAACVRVKNIKSLKTIIDQQLGVVSNASTFRYTKDHQRNHFLKSSEDSWQREYRLFWDLKEPQLVALPPGVAEEVLL